MEPGRTGNQFSVEALLKRPDGLAITTWAGRETSLDILPHFELDWKSLRKYQIESGKPIADLGASFSTPAVEGIMRGLDFIPLDINFSNVRDRYLERIFESAEIGMLGEYYTGEKRFPKGFEFKQTFANYRDFYLALEKAANTALVKGGDCDVADMPFSSRHFSCVICHETVPKHSATVSDFISKQLPEILRVTDQAAFIGPFQKYRTIVDVPNDIYEILEDKAISRNPELMKEVAELAGRLGFTVKIAQMKPSLGPPRPADEHNAGPDDYAVFSRAP